MNLKIVNIKKFLRTFIIMIGIVLTLIIMNFSNTYSKSETKYKEEYIGSGETLWSIAENEVKTNPYYKDADIRKVVYEIKEINNINDSNLIIGQKILISTIK